MPPATFDETTVDISAGGVSLPRQGLRAEVRGLDGGLQPGRIAARRAANAAGRGPTPSRRRTTRATGVLPPLQRRRSARAEGAASRSRSSRSRRRATAKRRWSRRWKRTASAGPSTYASIISVIQARDYVNKIEGRFKPTILGMMLVDKLLSPAFDDILDVELHARARGGPRQDRGGQGRTTSRRSSSFYKKFEKDSEARRQGDDQPQGRRRAGSAGGVRQVRQADGHQGRQVRPVPRLQRLSRVREHPRARDARSRRRRRGNRRDVRELRQADGDQARPLRPVPRLHRLSGVQDDAEDHRDEAGA